jgi:uncharacterized membrane protein
VSEQSVERGQATGNLWLSLWVLSAALIGQGALEVIELGGRWPLWLASVAPIILFLFGVSRDDLQWIIWYCLLLLFYFVSAVEDVFARPNHVIVVSGLIIIVLLFSVCTAYIRFRGRERRTAQAIEE